MKITAGINFQCMWHRIFREYPLVAIEDIEIFIMAQRLENLDSRLKKIEVEKCLLVNGGNKENSQPPRKMIIGNGNTAQCVSDDSTSISGEASGRVENDKEEGEGKWTSVVRKGMKKNTKILQKVVGINKTQSSTIKSAKQL